MLTERKYKIFSRIAIPVVALISIISLSFLPNLKFDYDFESFFPTNDPDLKFYLDYREKFEYDNEFMLVALENKNGIFKKDFLRKVQLLTDSVSGFQYVVKIVSPTNIKKPVLTPLGLMEIPLLHVDNPDQYASDSIEIFQSKDLVGSLFAKNGGSLSIYIKTKEGISKKASDSLLFNLESLLQSMKFDAVHVAGKIKAQKVYIEKIQSDFFTFFVSSFVLVIIFLFISFRSWWGIWLPMLVIFFSMIWIFGFMGAIHKPLDVMMVLLPTMIFIVGMSDVVHIISRYLEEIRYGRDSFQALKVTLRDVALPTFLTLITTAAGFLVLLYSDIKPIRDFGIYTSLGILVAFILSFSLLPVLIPSVKLSSVKVKENNTMFWYKQLHKLLLWIFRNKRKIIFGYAVILFISLVGIWLIKINSSLLEDIVDDHQLKKDFFFFEDKYSGVRPFEMAVWTDANYTLLDKEVLQELDTLQYYLEHTYGAGYIISPLSFVKESNRALNNGYSENYKLPTDTNEINEAVSLLKKMRRRKELKSILSEDFKEGRITGKMADLGSARIEGMNKALEAFIHDNLKYIHFKITGTATLIDKNNSYLVQNMLSGILISVLIVSLIIALVHRSVRMIVISIIPNIIPMAVVGGLMGYAGIELKVSTAIIFSIAFGIATDDTIHFLARFRLELSKGRSLLYAIKRTFISTGKAVVVTSLILIGGFLSLILSSFQSTFYFGLLVSILLLVAVITDLLLLPILLLWMEGKGKNN